MLRVGCYIDGFNLYRAIDHLSAGAKQSLDHCKWLNLDALTRVFIDPAEHTVGFVKYFTAFQYWRPKRVARHKTYIKALENVGVQTIWGSSRRNRNSANSVGALSRGTRKKNLT